VTFHIVEGSGKNFRVLICDDSSVQRIVLKKLLSADFECMTSKDADEAIALLKSQAFDLLILDISMRSDQEGLEYLPRLRAENPDLGIIISSNHSDYQFVRQALTQGADDFLSKTASSDEIRLALQRVLDVRKLRRKTFQKEREIRRNLQEKTLVGISPAMDKLKSKIQKVKDSKVNVIISGDSGTGKELVAKALRGLDEDGNLETFVAVDSSTIQSSMAESLLFGHERGAFTGADKARAGLFEEANGGVIYFDEISNMPLEIQRKLLRVIQEKEVCRLGSTQVRKLEFRVICATNQNLEKLVAEGRFQFDLLHRLGVVTLDVPTLAERMDDLELLIEHYFKSHPHAAHMSFRSEAMDALSNYDWPGNVRELFNVLAYLSTMCDQPEVGFEDLPRKIQLAGSSAVGGQTLPTQQVKASYSSLFSEKYQDSVKDFEREFMIQAYVKSGKKIARMAREIGLDRSYLYSKLKSLDLFPIEKLKELAR